MYIMFYCLNYLLVNDQLMNIIQRRCDEAATHIENKKEGSKNKEEPEGKRFTIDKAVITLTDFIEEDEIEVWFLKIYFYLKFWI